MWETAEKIMQAITKLVPPVEGASDKHVRRWRLWIAAATFLNALGLSIHIALACGFAAPFYSGFAQASNVEGIKGDMSIVKAELQKKRIKELTSLILDAKQKHCAASGEVRRLYLSAYNDLRDEYYDLTKREAPDPPCADFQ